MGWIIAGIILIIILILVLGKAKVTVDLSESLVIKIKYMFFPILTIPSKKKAPDKPKKPKKEKKEKEEKADKKPKKKISLSLDNILDLARFAFSSIGKPLRKILKRIEISHLALNVVCGGEDAAKAAITFGAVNMAVGNLLGWFDTIFTLKPVDELSVNVDFESEKTTADAYVEVKLTIAAVFAFVFTLIGRLIRHYLTHKGAREAIKKLV